MRVYEKSLGKVSITPEGDWENKKYSRLSLVKYPSTGNVYISKKDVPTNIDITNTEYWMLISENVITIVEVLPRVGDTTKIYLVGSSDYSYEIYIYVDNKWVKVVGNANIEAASLSEIDSLFSGGGGGGSESSSSGGDEPHSPEYVVLDRFGNTETSGIAYCIRYGGQEEVPLDDLGYIPLFGYSDDFIYTEYDYQVVERDDIHRFVIISINDQQYRIYGDEWNKL